MSSKEKIWRYLITHNNQATNAELANWLRGEKGQLSIGQRLRELRQELQAKGADLTCKEIKPGIYLYSIVYPESPRTEQEQALVDNFHKQEEAVNRKVFEKKGQMAWV